MVDRDKVQARESRCYGTARVQVDSARDVTLWTCYISHWTLVTGLGLRLMSRGAFPGGHWQ